MRLLQLMRTRLFNYVKSYMILRILSNKTVCDMTQKCTTDFK